MDIDKFRSAINAREQTDDEQTECVQKCQNDLVDIVCDDMDGTIQYLLTDCTADEFSWLSEVFDEIVERLPRRDFVDALWFLSKKYPEETAKYNIVPFIESAEGFIGSSRQ